MRIERQRSGRMDVGRSYNTVMQRTMAPAMWCVTWPIIALLSAKNSKLLVGVSRLWVHWLIQKMISRQKLTPSRNTTSKNIVLPVAIANGTLNIRNRRLEIHCRLLWTRNKESLMEHMVTLIASATQICNPWSTWQHLQPYPRETRTKMMPWPPKDR